MLGCATCGNEPPLCDLCLEDRLANMKGHAASRGYAWGQAVAAELERRRRPLAPWPGFEGRAREIAERKVAEFAGGDARLLERLAEACWHDARRRYERLRGGG